MILIYGQIGTIRKALLILKTPIMVTLSGTMKTAGTMYLLWAGTIRASLHEATQLIFIATPWARHCDHPCFTDEEPDIFQASSLVN